MEIPRGLRRCLDTPLQNIVSKETKPLEKTISGIIIGLMTVLSLGTYAIYIHKYFAKRKVENLQDSLQNLILENNIQQVDSLLKKHPALKGNLRNAISLAIQSTNLDMLKLLIKNNFHVDDHIAGVTPLYKVLEGSYPGLKGKPIRYEIALFLIENGAKLKVSSISPPSPLALAMKLWNENPEEAKKVISMILMNGGRLEKDDLDYLNEKLSVDSLDSLIDFLKLVRNIHEGERQAFLKSLVK